ncbi:MAG: fumarylacetoacetate hydrolase family protein, partial [Desulfobacterales bacterium]|nr:fumarylacetoacetate hydrolase family protein [Desulfobacterales bacterium]
MTADPLFALATFQSHEGPRVGLVLGARLLEVNAALSLCPPREQESPAKIRPLSSMADLLERWDPLFSILCDAARFFKDNPEEMGPAPHVSDVALLAPVPSPGKMINAGLNFYDHAREMGLEIPSQGFQPNFFLKGDRNCIIGPSRPIRLSSDFVDWEAELAVIIGKKARDVRPEEAMDYVAGYTCHNDITDRGRMMKKDGGLDFFGGKSRETFGPLGPFLVPRPFVPNPGRLRIRCLLNNDVMQDFRTDQWIWGPESCIAYLSSCVTLMPGDVIALGTGAGTGWTKGLP